MHKEVKSYFARLEADVRKALKNKKLQRELAKEMAVKILATNNQIEVRPTPWNPLGSLGALDCYVLFSDALIEGVADIIIDELETRAK